MFWAAFVYLLNKKSSYGWIFLKISGVVGIGIKKDRFDFGGDLDQFLDPGFFQGHLQNRD